MDGGVGESWRDGLTLPVGLRTQVRSNSRDSALMDEDLTILGDLVLPRNESRDLISLLI